MEGMQNVSLNAPAGLLGKPVAEVLDALALALARASRHDEPPGKLRALSFVFPDGEPDALRAIGLYLKYDSSSLFSEYRDWSEAAVLRAEVIGIRLKWESNAEDYGSVNERFYH
jgi:hypothetical protein